MEKYILALDQGTTSSRAMIFNSEGKIISIAQQEFRQIFPKPGWVEHDPEDIWNSQYNVAQEAIRKADLKSENIHAIGITNQRETSIMWDKETGKTIGNAIVWQDRRTKTICDRLFNRGYQNLIREKTGLVIDAYFSATKIMWMFENYPGLRDKALAGKIAFGTVDSWLIWKLSNGKKHVTDPTNASRTMLYNIHNLSWDAELLNILKIPAEILPRVADSSEIVASTDLFGREIPIGGIAGDQQAALFGQMCTKKGMAKNTYGTGCFILMNTGKKAVLSKNNLITTIALKIGDQTKYALEGTIFNAGTVVQWLRDGLGIIKSSSDIEKLAAHAGDNGGVYFVPSFTGLGAPYWNPEAQGLISGISRGTTSAHIARAALEGIAFRTMEVLKVMKKDSGVKIKQLRVDGGASVNDLLMQFQSDLINTKLVRPEVTETTALGAAYLAGLSTGYWESIESIKKLWKPGKKFHPSGLDTTEMKKAWKNAVRKTLSDKIK